MLQNSAADLPAALRKDQSGKFVAAACVHMSRCNICFSLNKLVHKNCFQFLHVSPTQMPSKTICKITTKMLLGLRPQTRDQEQSAAVLSCHKCDEEAKDYDKLKAIGTTAMYPALRQHWSACNPSGKLLAISHAHSINASVLQIYRVPIPSRIASQGSTSFCCFRSRVTMHILVYKKERWTQTCPTT